MPPKERVLHLARPATFVGSACGKEIGVNAVYVYYANSLSEVTCKACRLSVYYKELQRTTKVAEQHNELKNWHINYTGLQPKERRQEDGSS